MASIRKHRGKYQVRVRRNGFAPITKTFLKLSDAKEWANLQERQADRGELGPDRKVLETISMTDLVTRYRDTILPGKKGGSVEAIMLTAFLRHPICKKRLPTTHDRIKRNFPQILSLIKAHALLHFWNRKGDGGTVLANADDYAAVRALVNDPLSQGLAVAVPDGIRLMVEGVEKCLGDRNQDIFEGSGVSQAKLSEFLDRDQSVISRNVTKAIEQGYLRNENPGQGREARLTIGERKLLSGSVLPPVEDLFSPKATYAGPKRAPEFA